MNKKLSTLMGASFIATGISFVTMMPSYSASLLTDASCNSTGDPESPSCDQGFEADYSYEITLTQSNSDSSVFTKELPTADREIVQTENGLFSHLCTICNKIILEQFSSSYLTFPPCPPSLPPHQNVFVKNLHL